jgi:hypothetical protein
MRTIQLALLQQQYAPNHPLFSKNPTSTTPTMELAGLNVGSSEFGSDKVTIGDATSVRLPSKPLGDCRFKEDFLFLHLRRQCRGYRL